MKFDDDSIFIDFSETKQKRTFIDYVNLLSGPHEVKVKKRYRRKTLDQLGYYFAGFVVPFREYLRVEWGDPYLKTEEAHYEMKRHILGVQERVNKRTGEILQRVPSIKDFDAFEMAIYMDKAKVWLDDFAGIIVQPPEMYYEAKQAKPKAAPKLSRAA